MWYGSPFRKSLTRSQLIAWSAALYATRPPLHLLTLFLHLPKGHPVQSPLRGQLGRPHRPSTRYSRFVLPSHHRQMSQVSKSTQLAEQVCNLLLKRFPCLVFEHEDADIFFDGYHDVPGFPHNDLFTPVWFQEGRLVYWEAPKQYYWDSEALDFDAPDPEDDEVRINFLFIHDDGYIAAVDDYEGETHRLMTTPTAEALTAYIQLHFDAGRQQLRQIGEATAPAITQITVPFFNFPDDFSQIYQTMPVVPVHCVRDTIFRHLAENKQWLFGMNDLTDELKKMIQKIEAPKEGISFGDDDDAMTITGHEFVYTLTAGAQQEIESERPNIIRDAQALPSEEFDRGWDTKNHFEWNHPYHDLGATDSFPTGYLPICLLLSKSVFPGALDPAFSTSTQAEIFKIVSEHIQSSESLEQCIPLELPPYEEQVLNCFLQTILIDQGPELVKRAMRSSKTRSGSFEDSLRRRREIAKNLMRRI
jgi:hypothetical protein